MKKRWQGSLWTGMGLILGGGLLLALAPLIHLIESLAIATLRAANGRGF